MSQLDKYLHFETFSKTSKRPVLLVEMNQEVLEIKRELDLEVLRFRDFLE